MSIITYDGKQLAGDSRRSIKKWNEKKQRYDRVITSDEAVKIEEIHDSKVLFRGQVVLAVARCGNAKITGEVLKKLKKGVDIEAYYTKQLEDEEAKKRTCSLLLVTPRSLWHFKLTKSKLVIYELEPKPFAMGSGVQEAIFLMKTLKLTAEEAAMAITLGFDCCGGAIQVMERDKWTGTLALRKKPATNLSGDERLVYLAKSITRRFGPAVKKAEARIEVKRTLNKVATPTKTKARKQVA